MGLLLSHKRKLRIWNDRISISGECEDESHGGGLRGDVKAFSKQSRMRLFQMLHELKFESVTFETLTYPLDFPTDPKIYKAHLKEYRRRYELRYGKVKTVWRLEFQLRGAPHYHLMRLDAPFIPVLDLCNLWADVVHSDSAAHRKIGVDIKLSTGGKEGRLIAVYLAKYVAKIDDRPNIDLEKGVGRWWGKWNIKDELPIEIEIWESEAIKIVDNLLANKPGNKWEPSDPSRCTVFGDAMGTDKFSLDVIRAIKSVRANPQSA
jgi:hypothetical protein